MSGQEAENGLSPYQDLKMLYSNGHNTESQALRL